MNGEYTGYYEGEFKNDLPHGKGVLEEFGRLIYEGEFAEGYPNGKGSMEWYDGTK